MRCSRHARNLGYARELVAIKFRHRRHQPAWAPHLARCRSTILASAGKPSAPDQAIAVLGCGWLEDIPARELLELGWNLALVDIVLTPAARRLARAYPSRVTLVECDLTGWGDLSDDEKMVVACSTAPLPAPKLCGNFALAISCCVWSQLPMLPRHWLENHGVEEGMVTAFCRAIQEHHIRTLQSLAQRSLLITDTTVVAHSATGTVLGEEPLGDTSALGTPSKVWDWAVAPLGEACADESYTHRVGCWENPSLLACDNSRVVA